jgi:hypothetical protein
MYEEEYRKLMEFIEHHQKGQCMYYSDVRRREKNTEN